MSNPKTLQYLQRNSKSSVPAREKPKKRKILSKRFPDGKEINSRLYVTRNSHPPGIQGRTGRFFSCVKKSFSTRLTKDTQGNMEDRWITERWNELLLEIKDDKEFQTYMIKRAENYIKARGRKVLRQKQKEILAAMENLDTK